MWIDLQKPIVVNLVTRYFKARGQDQEVILVNYLRGFPATNEPYLNKYRVKPSAPLI